MSDVKRLQERDGEQGEGTVAFEVTKAVALAALEDEIRVAHEWRNGPGLVAEGDLADPEAPVVIWVTRGDANLRTVKRVLAAHQGVEDRDDAVEPLTDDEIRAVRLLLMRST